MGLSGLFGVSKSTNGQPATRVSTAGFTAPGPTAKPTGVAMPDSVKQSAASAAMAALAASQKQRKKAAAGSSSSIAQPTGTVLTSTAQPKTLLGY